MPIPVPAGVEVSIGADSISVKGPLGTLRQFLHPLVGVAQSGSTLQVEAKDAAQRMSVALSGTFRAIIANMVQGVSKVVPVDFRELETRAVAGIRTESVARFFSLGGVFIARWGQGRNADADRDCDQGQ